MKKLNMLLFLVPVLALSCKHEVVYDIDYSISLDKSNTYEVGTPVRFNFSGEVDNIVFYSGETGHRYEFRNRYEVSREAVKEASLQIDYQARYGDPGAMEVWISKEFAGLSGTDAAADKATVKAMTEGNMAGWERLEYQEGASQKWTTQKYPLNEYMSSFAIAFHWNPKDNKKTQRSYWINGGITLDLEGMKPSTINFSGLDFVTVMMNDEIEDPYMKNNGNGSIILNKPSTATLIFQGIGANALPYAIDGWVISKATPLNKVANDKGVAIKNLQNYLHTFEYTWTEPGTYTVTFVGTNSNYAGASQDVKEMTITIFDSKE